MSVITFAADSTTLTLNGYAFTSFNAGDILELAPVNEFASQVNSSSGGVSIQKRSDGDVHNLTVRIQKYSDDDVFLNSEMNQDDVTLFSGSVKENFEKDDTAGIGTWTLENGTFMTRPTDTRNDQEGNQMLEYVLQFRSATRSL